MKGGKSDKPLRSRKPREVTNNPNELISTRVLRSHKRKLAESEQKDEPKVVEKKKKTPNISVVPDCIVLGDSDSVNKGADVNKVITSTPNQRSCLKIPDFDESCIKSNNKSQPKDNTVDVIVISDNSTPSLSVIVLSDSDTSDVEVISSKKVTPRKELQINYSENKQNKEENIVTDKINKNIVENPLQPNDANVLLNKVPYNKPMFYSRKPKHIRQKKWEDKPVQQRSIARHPCQVGENIYVENPVVLPTTGLRPIIIDGSNVAFHHSNNSYFSCRGLEICIKYFKNRGHEVIAFVPQYRVKYKESDNPKLLELLVRNGDVVLTPSRVVNGNRIVPYDDRFIVQTAVIKGGIIVTRDNYQDLLIENPSWAETIHYRLLQFTWVQDLLMFPNDPLGKSGPSLDEFLRFGSGK